MSEQVVTLQVKLDNISDSEMQDILVNLDEMKKCLHVEDKNRFNIKNFYEIHGEVLDEYIVLQDKIEEFLNTIKEKYSTIGFYGMVTLDDSVTGSYVDLYKKYPNSKKIFHTEYENENIEFFDKYEKDKKYKKSIVENITHSQKYLIFFNEIYYLLEYKDCIEILNDRYLHLSKDIKFMNDDDLCNLLSVQDCTKYLKKYTISKDDALELVKMNSSNNQTNKDSEKFLATNIIDYLNDIDTREILSKNFDNVEIEKYSSFEKMLYSFMLKDCESAFEFWKDILLKNKMSLNRYYPYRTLVYEPVVKLLENDQKKSLIEALVKDETFRNLLLAVFDFTLTNSLFDEEVNFVRYEILKEISLQGYHDLFIEIMGDNLLTWEDKVLDQFLKESHEKSSFDKSICIDLIKVIKNIPLTYSRVNYLLSSESLYRQLDCYIFEIAGTEYRMKKTLKKYAEEDVIVKLVPEPTNEYDKKAIRVEAGSKAHLGYVPKFLASKIRDVEKYFCKIAAVHVTARGKYIIVVEAIPKGKNIF